MFHSTADCTPATRGRSFAARFALLLTLTALLLAATPPFAARAQDRPFSLPSGWSEELLVRNLGAPTAFALAPDGRIYIALKPGRVKVIDNGVLQNGAFIDLTGETNTYADRGLMGIALHPDFPSTPWVYLAYVWDPPETANGEGAAAADGAGRRSARVVRVKADPNNLNVHLPGSLQVLVGGGGTPEAIGALDVHDRPPFACALPSGGYAADCLPVDGPSHTVDALRFGPDGALYISAGDATLQPETNQRAQNPNSLAGKLLRVDAETGAGLADNPWFDGDPNSNRARVFAVGMRNPFRFAFHPQTGELYLGDVGAESWEEINRVRAGANLGWPCFEGPQRARSDGACGGLSAGQVTFAPHSYPHEGQYSAAIAGDFLPSEGLPAPYAGAYIYGDHNRAALLLLEPGWEQGDGVATEFATNAIAPVQITAGQDGALYVLSFVTGSLSRLTYVGGENAPPAAVAAADTLSGELPLTVHFSSEGSRDPNGDPLSLRWDFGDGGSSDEVAPVHTYEKPGRFEVRLTATDSAGASRTALLAVSAGNAAPEIRLEQRSGPSAPAPGDVLTFFALAVDAEEGALPAARITWSGVLHHNEHTHSDYANGSGELLTLTWDDHGENTWLELCATAADDQGLAGRACLAIGDAAPDDALLQSAAEPEEIAASEPLTHTHAATDTTPHTHTVDAADGDAGDGDPTDAAEEAADDHSDDAGHADALPATGAGLLLERWQPLGGATVADLVRSPAWQGAPDATEIVPTLRLSGYGKDYGQRLRGWLTPTSSGPTTFWIAGDDGAELWLSSDASPANAVVIASVPGWCSIDDFAKYPEQKSPAIELEAGRRYYIEIRHKQADQKDGLAVAWQPPGAVRATLGGAVLAPWE